MVVAGSMVAASLILRYFYNAIARIADRLGINAYSVVGLIASLATCISMIDRPGPRLSPGERRRRHGGHPAGQRGLAPQPAGL